MLYQSMLVDVSILPCCLYKSRKILNKRDKNEKFKTNTNSLYLFLFLVIYTKLIDKKYIQNIVA